MTYHEAQRIAFMRQGKPLADDAELAEAAHVLATRTMELEHALIRIHYGITGKPRIKKGAEQRKLDEIKSTIDRELQACGFRLEGNRYTR